MEQKQGSPDPVGSNNMKITQKQLKEMVQKLVRARLSEDTKPKTVKITIEQLREMINHAVKDKLTEAPKGDLPDKWVKYMKDVEDMLSDVSDKAKKLHEDGETLKAEEREKDTVANPGNADRKGHYQHVDERSEALKELVSTISRKLEVWKTKY